MKIFLLLIVVFGAVYLIQQKFSLLPVEDSYLKAEDLSNTTIQKNGNTIIINFAKCIPDKKTFAFGFGSGTIQIVGFADDVCQIKYGGEIEDPKWDGKLNTTCGVPVNKGTLYFQTDNYSIDFSSIKKYCKTE